ncbi:MAG: VWA domain-containing protein [Candidatus Omnitrophica bacterium]|nr:VWA domain-containing protein [Candidatus Omnitrophota bacterium]
MQFLYPEWLSGFWIVFALLIFFLWTGKRKKSLLEKFGKWQTLKSLIEFHSKEKEQIKKILLLAVLSLLILALARPQWGETKKEIERKGVEVIFLVDTSLSMLAEDASPSRIGKAKLEMKSALRQLKGDRIGIVTFAGSGFIQSPLTLDYDAFILFANSIQVGYIPDAGTSLSQAIRTAVKGFAKSKQKNHVVILLSDGEDLEGDVEAAVKLAKEAKIRIYTVGIGTKEGAPIPLRSEQGKVSGYKKDRSGEIVITKLNEPLLTQAAEQTGGLYFPASAGEREMEWIYQHMQNLEKGEFKQRLVIEREDHFQFFLAFAIILLLIETLMSDTKRYAQI